MTHKHSETKHNDSTQHSAHSHNEAQHAETKEASHIDHIAPEELRKRIEKARLLVHELQGILPPLISLTEEDRKYSQGRMRDGEPGILRTILDAVDTYPSHFASLADKDEGHDPNKFETDLLRARLERRELLQGLTNDLRPLVDGLDDTIMHLGGMTRPAALAAYRLAKALANTDQKMRSLLAKAIDFYAAPAKARAQAQASKLQATTHNTSTT